MTTDPPTASTSLPIGSLEHVPLRHVWVHEAQNFTPWLAGNLDRLAEALGVGELVLIGQEYSVGPFSLDILAETVAGARVMIENQLETSDHRHLGQCLTYAAGVGAAIVVWVMPRLLSEHRAALDWLNEHTDESVQFFGVEVSAVRIGDSPVAPIFAVEARPNGWQKQARSSAVAASTSTWSGWELAYEALARVPAGRWTSVNDLATLIGTSAGWVGRHMYEQRHLPNFHRMLSRDGSPWQHFRWPTDGDERDVTTVLADEGIGFVAGKAQQSQRLTSAELEALLYETSPSDGSSPPT